MSLRILNPEKVLPILKGTVKHFPGIKRFLPKRTGGTIECRYCYSVWMRHLKHFAAFKEGIPSVVAELGPGDSLGTGLAALLSGCEKLYALDVVHYRDVEKNSVRVFDGLVELFSRRAPIPGSSEYPNVRPGIDSYDFPRDILTDERLRKSLDRDRIISIRNELSEGGKSWKSMIHVHIPWNGVEVIREGSVDFIYSQAVLEHVEDLENAYRTMWTWLKPSGLMSHVIDFKSHGITRRWNGHWMFSDCEWEIVKGGKEFLINRLPYSRHVELQLKTGFSILMKSLVRTENKLTADHLATRYKQMKPDDLSTSGMYILSAKKEKQV